jgi:peptide chain release factor 3
MPGDRFCGVFHRPSAKVYLYTKGGRGKGAARSEYDLTDPSLEGLIEPDLWEQLQEEVELLEVRARARVCVEASRKGCQAVGTFPPVRTLQHPSSEPQALPACVLT